MSRHGWAQRPENGLGAAIAAARLGRKVVLAEYEDHIGGIVTNGLTNADLAKKQAVAGLYYEFTRRVVKHYEDLDRGVPGTPEPGRPAAATAIITKLTSPSRSSRKCSRARESGFGFNRSLNSGAPSSSKIDWRRS